MNRAVVVMGKLPRPGRVKTRLLSRLGPDLVAELYAAFLSDTLKTVAEVPGEKVFACALDDASEIEVAHRIAPGWRVVPQRGRDLGERLQHARQDAGTENVVIIGSDSPTLPASRIEAAFAFLDPQTAVLGPTRDGGYDLIAFCGAMHALLLDIPWSTALVRATTQARAAAAGIKLVLLDERADVDEPEDLLLLAADPDLPRAQATARLLPQVLLALADSAS